MTITIQPENNVIVDVRTLVTDWAVYEHWATLKDGEPPQCIFVGASKIPDVYRLIDARSNSQWAKIFANGGMVMVRIIATSPERSEIVQKAIQLAKTHNPMPVCNVNGYHLYGALRRIECSDGQIFENQEHAARSLGTHQSAISRHLLGHTSHVKGYKLTYIGAE